MPVTLLAMITALLAQSETVPPRQRPPEAHYQPFSTAYLNLGLLASTLWLAFV
jgi:hypothetical protein